MSDASSPSAPRIPGYLHHKGTGQARVRINGEDYYLGPYGSEASRRKYGELIAQHASGLPLDPFQVTDGEDDPGISIAVLVLGYQKHAEQYYRKNGKVTDEFGCIKSALAPLTELYGTLPAGEFGPLALKAVRQKMVDSGKKCRRYINMSIGRIRRCFRWGVENELIEPSVLQKLEAVAPLMAGRTEAKDHAPRKPVPLENIELVKAKVPQRTRDMIELWLLCGARPGELVSLTTAMIDRTKEIWVCRLDNHKTVHRGKARTLYFGPKAQLILRRYMKSDETQRLFPIRRATASNAMKAACAELGLPRFTAHWLRHTAATRIREEFGLDAAQVILGHAHADVTQIYADLNDEKAVQVARDAG